MSIRGIRKYSVIGNFFKRLAQTHQAKPPGIFKSIISDLDVHPEKRYKRRPGEEIKYIVVHRCKLSDVTDYGDTEQDLAKYFINEMNWPGFPYHFSINKKGNIFQCQPLSLITYQVHNYNKRCIGVRLEGDFREEEPTSLQYASLVQIATNIIIFMGFTEFNVKGHSEFSGHEKKECPGKMLDLDLLRSDVKVQREYQVKSFGFVE